MVKKIALIIISLLCLSYLVYATYSFTNTPQDEICYKVHIFKMDSIKYNFIKRSEIERKLKDENIYPKGKIVDYTLAHGIEKSISKMNYVKRVETYRTNNGNIVIRIWQREPAVRVLTPYTTYYIDKDRKKMPTSPNFTVMLPVVSGNVTETMAKNEIYDFITYINADSFWQAQIEQIHVLDNQKIILVPKIGQYTISLGTLDDYQDKLKKLLGFYQSYPQHLTSDYYTNISIEYNNLLYATRKNKK